MCNGGNKAVYSTLICMYDVSVDFNDINSRCQCVIEELYNSRYNYHTFFPSLFH